MSASTMLISVQCPRCDHAFRVDPVHAGKVGRCPNTSCAAPVKIPTHLSAEPEPVVRPSRKAASRKHTPPRPVRRKPTPRQSDKSRRQPVSRSKPPRSRSRETVTSSRNSLPARRSSRRTAKTRKGRGRSRSGFPVRFAGGFIVITLALAGFYAVMTNRPATVTSGGNTLLAAEAQEQVDHQTWDEKVRPFFEKHCFDCHGDNDGDAGLNLASYQTAADVTEHRKTFERIFRMLNAEAMPPGDYDPQPTKDERAVVVTWLEDQLFNFDCQLIDDPGRPTIQRLNRAEYNNTIRDLVGVDFEPAEDFPSDDVGEGFDNIGDVLSLSPLLLEKYLDAAEEITRRAIVSDDLSAPRTLAQRGNELSSAGAARHGGEGFVTMYSTGEARADFTVPVAGDYVIRIEAKATQAGDELAKMEFRVNGSGVHVVDVPGRNRVGNFQYKTRLSAGKVRIAGRFINDRVIGKQDRNLFVRQISLLGPENAGDPVYPETHRRIVIARPGPGKNVRQAATEVLQTFARRAFRRPVGQDEVSKYVNLVVNAVQQGDTWHEGIQLGVQAILVSPHFLFRVETDARPDDPSDSHQVNDHELASRLSYFLWSSMPDEELMSLADQGRLNDERVLAAQTRRMLSDPKAAALTQNFATQWLNLRNLDELTPDPDQFKSFNEQLKQDMIRESELLFESIVREDRNVLDFLDADYTFVNERLARHYEMTGVKGSGFRKVSLKGTGRAGIMTHASILTLTSNPTRTSPVKRGKWIMDNLLNDPPPPPPPNVPDLEESVKANPELSLREQLAIHRESPTCASCHKTMDPLGFGFEKFDPVGRIRDQADGKPVDPSGELPTGESFAGALELVQILKKRGEDFCRCLSEKMMTYALGRGLDYYDRCAIDQVYDRMQKNELRFSAMVEGIVLSQPFRQRRGERAKKAD